MRSSALPSLLTLLAAALLAGCTATPDADGGASSDATGDGTPATVSTTQDLEFSGTVAGSSAGGVERRVPFNVPEGTLRMTAEAEWDCVSLCPLSVYLQEPGDGDFAAEASGGSDATMEVQDPAAGEWRFVWRPRDQASVEPQGTVHLTFESLE